MARERVDGRGPQDLRKARPMRVLLASSNPGKLEDFRLLFGGSGVELELPTAAAFPLHVAETGRSFAENALIKARAMFGASGRPALADDSGLVVDALGGAPGIHSARYAGPSRDDHANNLKVLDALRGLDNRSAGFVCALALVLPDSREILVQGRCRGRIIGAERGANGFGYDAIFFHEGLGRTFGEVSSGEKNAHSHRAAAVRALLAALDRDGLLP